MAVQLGFLFLGLVAAAVAIWIRVSRDAAYGARVAGWILTCLSSLAIVQSVAGLLRASEFGRTEEIASLIDWTSQTMFWVIAAWAVTAAIELFLWEAWVRRRTGTEASKILRGLVAMVVYVIIGLCITAFVYDRSITAMLVSTGVVAAVFGLALQGVLSDLLAGIAITFERPYRIGDWIETESEVWGQIVDINWRTTRVHSWNNGVYVLPNRRAAEMIIHNHSLGEERYALWVDVKVNANLPVAGLRQVLLDALIRCPAVLDDPLPSVFVSDATTQPYKYMLFMSFESYAGHWAGKDSMYEYVTEALARAGVSPSATTFELANRDAAPPSFESPSALPQLREVDILSPLSDGDLARLHERAHLEMHAAEQYIIRQGDAGDSLFVLISGVARVKIDRADGSCVDVGQLQAGSCVGEIALLTGEARSANIVAATNVEALEVRRALLEPLLDEKPELYEAFARKVAEHRARDEGLDTDDIATSRSKLEEYAAEAIIRLRKLFATTAKPDA